MIVKIDAEYFRPTEVKTLLDDISKAKREPGWSLKVSIDELISEMVDADNKLVREEVTLKLDV